MKKCTIGTAKTAAAAVVAAAVSLSSAASHAGDSVPDVAPAERVADAGANRPVVLRTIKVGGLRAGDAVVVTGRGAERVNPKTDGGAQCASAGSAAGG